MQLTKKQTEFWACIFFLCLTIAAIITLVDFGIKAAILEESNRLWLKIEEWEVKNGRNHQKANSDGNSPDTGDNSPISGIVLVDDAFRMETADVPVGNQITIDDSSSKQPGTR